MPYYVTKKDSGYKVTSAKHPQGFSKAPMSKAKAKKQQAAIYANADPANESFERRLAEALDTLDEFYGGDKPGLDAHDKDADREGHAIKKAPARRRPKHTTTTSRKGTNNTFGGVGGRASVTSIDADQIPTR